MQGLRQGIRGKLSLLARNKMLQHTSAGALGAGGMYLLQEYRYWREIQHSFQHDTPRFTPVSSDPLLEDDGSPLLEENTPAVVNATEKEWIILGRQSPGYVRDSKKTSKLHVMHSILESSLLIKQLGTVMDNEKHYRLFEGSEFEVQLFTRNDKIPRTRVSPDKMLGMDWRAIEDTALFEVGFARKQGFANITQQSPLYHSSIACRVVSEERPASSSSLVMTGAEIKKVIQKTNQEICREQHCDLYSSNCYSASVYAMTQMIHLIDERTKDFAQNTADISKVIPVLHEAIGENLSRGVSNNETVRHAITSEVHQILVKHKLADPKAAEIAAAQTDLAAEHSTRFFSP